MAPHTTLQAREFPRGGSLVWFIFGLLLLAVDLFTRWWCFSVACSTRFFFGVGLTLFPNYNFAFSLPVYGPLMYAVYGVALAAIAWHIATRWSGFATAVRVAWVCIFSGALANIGERIALGYVRDFIQIGTGYINLGDAYIVAGAVYIFCRSFLRARRV